MAKKTVTCDVCGLEMNYADSIWDIGGERDLCSKCAREYALQETNRERDSLQSWLDVNHLKRLRELDAKIAELESPVLMP